MSKVVPGSFHKTCVNSIHPLATEQIDLKDAHVQANSERATVQNDLFDDLNIFSKSHMVDVRNGRIIHVQHFVPNDNNADKNVVLFFIHGVGGSWKIWTAQIKNFFSEGFEIIAFNLLGHGLSSALEEFQPYEFSELALDVLFIFDRFCKRRNVLIGHSYGTSFCVLLSAERKNLVSKVVLISGGGPTALLPDKCSAFCLPFPIFSLMLPILLKIFRRMAFHEKTKQEDQEKFNTFTASAYVLKAVMQGQKWEESDERYHSNLSIPALLIYGRGDQFVKLEDEIWMNETMYGSKLEVVENAGHMVMIEAPTVVNLMIQEFLNLDASTSRIIDREPIRSSSSV